MNTRFDVQTMALILGWIGTACWMVCFWWMHRLSSKQETMLREIKESVEEVSDAISGPNQADAHAN